MQDTIFDSATRRKDCIASRVRKAYLFGLTLIAAIVIGIFLLERHSIATLEHSTAIINVSGKQHMLSQRIALYAQSYADAGNEQPPDEVTTELTALRNQFALHHQIIMDLDAQSDRMMTELVIKIYFGGKYATDLRVQEYLTMIDALLIAQPAERSTIMDQIDTYAREVLPVPLDAAVQQFEADTLADVKSSKRIQLVMFIVMLHAIVAELLLIFRPLARQVIEKTRELEIARIESQHAALHDPLTDLPNRRYLSEVLNKVQMKMQRDGNQMTICQVDLDRFKHINDTLGHSIGDKVLKRVAQILRENTRDTDFIARVGGDEFVIVDCGTCGTKDAHKMAQRIVDEVNQPMVIEERNIMIGASIGIAASVTDDTDTDAVLGRADIALYRAKDQGRSRVCVYSSRAAA